MSKNDGFVKNPYAALRCILRHSHPKRLRLLEPGRRTKSTPHYSEFARLAYKLFTKPSIFSLVD